MACKRGGITSRYTTYTFCNFDKVHMRPKTVLWNDLCEYGNATPLNCSSGSVININLKMFRSMLGHHIRGPRKLPYVRGSALSLYVKKYYISSARHSSNSGFRYLLSMRQAFASPTVIRSQTSSIRTAYHGGLRQVTLTSLYTGSYTGYPRVGARNTNNHKQTSFCSRP
jgi:hypothetical protein